MNKNLLTKLKKNKKGFTLIELVVVIAILGILAALAIPRFNNARDNASKSAVAADARAIASEMEIAYAEDGEYPAASTDLLGNYSGTFTAYTVDNDAGTYSVTYTGDGGWAITFDQTGDISPDNVAK